MKSEKKWIALMELGERLGCHQLPERSFFVRGYQFPVCARCTGVLIASIVAVILFYKKRMPIMLCIGMSSVMLCDWTLQYLNIKKSTNCRRLVTGLIGGLGYSTLHLYGYYYLFNKIKELIVN